MYACVRRGWATKGVVESNQMSARAFGSTGYEKFRLNSLHESCHLLNLLSSSPPTPALSLSPSSYFNFVIMLKMIMMWLHFDKLKHFDYITEITKCVCACEEGMSLRKLISFY